MGRMARRNMKKKAPRRRKSQRINLVNLAESAILADAVTKGLFGANIVGFLTGRVDGKFAPGADGYATITLPELMGFSKTGFSVANIGGRYGTKSFLEGVQYNLANKGTQMAATLILTPIAFKVGKQLTAKPRRSANRLLDMTGLKSVVTV